MKMFYSLMVQRQIWAANPSPRGANLATASDPDPNICRLDRTDDRREQTDARLQDH